MASTRGQLPFAVVIFPSDRDEQDDDDTADADIVSSEVPSSWLNDSNTTCWWPEAKNLSSLIARQVKPHTGSFKWIQHSCICEGFYKTIEDARSKAGEVTSTDECQPEKNKKRKRKAKYHRSEYDLSSSDDDAMKSKLPDPPKIVSKTNGEIPIDTMTLPMEIENGMPNNVQIEIISEHGEEAEEDAENEILEDSLKKLKSDLEGHFNKLYNGIASIKLRLNGIEKALQGKSMLHPNILSEGEAHPVSEIPLPLKTIIEVDEMNEKLLVDRTVRHRFILALQKVGGDSAKDLLLRMLKKTFDNAVAKEYTWRGLKKNLKVGDLPIICAIKEAVLCVHNITDKDFEEEAAEWFRQAKQRYKRDVLKANSN